MGDDLRHGLELRIGADVVDVRMGMDDRRHWCFRRGRERIEHGPAPPGQLGIDQHDAVFTKKRERVATTAQEHVQDVSRVQGPEPDGL